MIFGKNGTADYLVGGYADKFGNKCRGRQFAY